MPRFGRAHTLNTLTSEDTRWPSFYTGGFESSSHCLRDGRRLDLAESTNHRRFADADYDRLVACGILGSREALAWHLIDRQGRYNFSSIDPILRASERTGVRIIWDLMHFGWPDDLDIFAPVFVERFAGLARAFAIYLSCRSKHAPWITPINEISFLSWAGGDVAGFNPFCSGRGFELKCQLVRASLAASRVIKDIAPNAIIFAHEPAFHVTAHPKELVANPAIEATRQTQYQAVDMLLGRTWPQLGGAPDAVDMLGLNYYPWNQWTLATEARPSVGIAWGDPSYLPLADILFEWSLRYGKPIYLGETGCEGESRAPWLRYATEAVHGARARGAYVAGVCVFPIVNFPGWDDDRHCMNGLWDYADETGHRDVDAALLKELLVQQQRT
jgi:hypothetical protein